MTKEQAKEILRYNTDLGHGVIIENESTQAIYEALNMTIEALEQNEVLQKENEDFRDYIDKANHTNSQLIQLIEKHKINRDTSDDCVSREKVWYMITGGKYSNEDYEQFIDRLVKELEKLPPVTPTHGTCKDCKHNYKTSRSTFKCSNGHRFYMRIPDTFYCADYEKRGNENE